MPCTIRAGFHHICSPASRSIFVKKYCDYHEHDAYEVYEVYEKRPSKSMQNMYGFSYKDEGHDSDRTWSHQTAHGRRVETAGEDRELISL